MKCKYFQLTGRCRHCPALNEKKGEEMECPKPNESCFKVYEWWQENRGENMVEFFEKLEQGERDFNKSMNERVNDEMFGSVAKL